MHGYDYSITFSIDSSVSCIKIQLLAFGNKATICSSSRISSWRAILAPPSSPFVVVSSLRVRSIWPSISRTQTQKACRKLASGKCEPFVIFRQDCCSTKGSHVCFVKFDCAVLGFALNLTLSRLPTSDLQKVFSVLGVSCQVFLGLLRMVTSRGFSLGT
jgi:hypothetical protein